MKTFRYLVVIAFCWFFMAVGCKKNLTADPEIRLNPNPTLFRPANFPLPSYQFIDNTLSNAGFELGRRLFFENALSINRSISCGSCHNPAAAFADPNGALSVGVNGCIGTRNAFPLFNLAWQTTFMWDGGTTDMERSSLNALITACEMGNTLPNIVRELSTMPVYPPMFQNAFGTPVITEDRIFKAITQFVGSMVSATSKYDKVKRSEQGAVFTAEETAGYNLFANKCITCHHEPLFTDETFRNNGLDMVSADAGRALITKNPADVAKFRVPSLRNVEVTRPYMHDGRFNSLMQVIDHYATGVVPHVNLDPELNKADGIGVPLSATQKNQLIAFLRTLTDHEFLADQRFRRPQ